MTITGLLLIASLAVYPLATATPTPTGSISKIPVFLPRDARVFLKNSRSMSGRLTKFDSRTKTVAIELSGESRNVAMKEMEKVHFQGEVIIKSGRLVIRGSGEKNDPNQNRQRWTEPLQNFKIIDVNEGKAEVTLTSLDSLEIGGIEDVVRNSSYVVEEIKFNPSDKIEIQVNPH